MPTHAEVVKSIEGFVQENLRLLKKVSDSWQPSDLLPNTAEPGWHEKVEKLQAEAQGVPEELLVVLVGNTVTEEALPAYQTMLNRHPGLQDDTGVSDTPWGRWTRGWTAEENRHGEILSRYLHLSGRIHMRAFEVTVQHLICNGFDAKTDNDPYRGLIYTSFQERATKISHGNTARLANQSGNSTLGSICALITGDESRHEEAYKLFAGKIFEIDPSEAVKAFAQMMKNTVTMPASQMDDGVTPDLYGQFAEVAQRIGVYTIHDYADIIDHLVGYWRITKLSGLTDDAARAQDYLGGLAQRYRKLAERPRVKPLDGPTAPFRWIFNRSV